MNNVDLSNMISKYMGNVTKNIAENRAKENKLDGEHLDQKDKALQTANTDKIKKFDNLRAFTPSSQVQNDPKFQQLQRDWVLNHQKN